MRVGIVSIVAGVAGIALLAAPAMAPAAPHISLSSNKRIVVFEQHAQLSGRLSSGKRGVKVLLRADRFPFGKKTTIASDRTRRSGRFGFRVRPSLASKYTVVLKKQGSVHSPLARVFVSPRAHAKCNLCGRSSSPGKHTLRLRETFLFPTRTSASKEAGKRAFFYYGQKDGGGKPHRLKLRRKTVAKRAGGRKTKVSIDYPVRFSRSGTRTRFILCVRDTPRSDGIGLPGNHHCGERSVPYHYGYLGRSAAPAASAQRR